jgi:hypothetical protein
LSADFPVDQLTSIGVKAIRFLEAVSNSSIGSVVTLA